MTEKNRIVIYLDNEKTEIIKDIADKEGRSVSNLIGFIIKQYISEHQFKTEKDSQ